MRHTAVAERDVNRAVREADLSDLAVLDVLQKIRKSQLGRDATASREVNAQADEHRKGDGGGDVETWTSKGRWQHRMSVSRRLNSGRSQARHRRTDLPPCDVRRGGF